MYLSDLVSDTEKMISEYSDTVASFVILSFVCRLIYKTAVTIVMYKEWFYVCSRLAEAFCEKSVFLFWLDSGWINFMCLIISVILVSGLGRDIAIHKKI